MGWGILSAILAAALGAWLAALLLILIWKGLRSARRSFEMMRDPVSGAYAPERIQAVAFSVVFIAAYLCVGLMSLADSAGPRMPAPPDWLVTILAASQTLYLSGKITRQ